MVLDFLSKHWGDLASLLGLAYTIWLVLQAKTAAEQARKAASEARDRIFSLDTIKELTTAKMALSEIIRLRRLNTRNVPWDIVLERYGSARDSLVRCSESLGIPYAQRRSIGEAIALLSIMVVDIERAWIQGDPGRLNTVRFNHSLSIQIDDLERARVAIERAKT
jgi:hypothetical protein